jgi:phage terminase large subunit-like protein
VRDSGLLPEKAAIGLDAAMATDLVDALDKLELADGLRCGGRPGLPPDECDRRPGTKAEVRSAVHSGSRLMAWCVSNAKEEKGRQSVMINKYAAGAAKIDPLMAASTRPSCSKRTRKRRGLHGLQVFV